MIDRPKNEREPRSDQAELAAARPNLVLHWYLEPTTGKPAARWVCERPSASHTEEVAAAA